ncbi:RHS repeat-associated core domain-containing protein [Stenotrophomonas maltophilia]|nr:RHS repeat-associated core domain-containing protein [Stenotrophomonas maltophilia]
MRRLWRHPTKSGLYYYRAHYYSPDMGRFISEDSYGFASGDVNFYAYALGNPISYSDPSGDIAWFVVLPLIWAGIEIALSIYDAIERGKTLLDSCETTETMDHVHLEVGGAAWSHAMAGWRKCPCWVPSSSCCSPKWRGESLVSKVG